MLILTFALISVLMVEFNRFILTEKEVCREDAFVRYFVRLVEVDRCVRISVKDYRLKHGKFLTYGVQQIKNIVERLNVLPLGICLPWVHLRFSIREKLNQMFGLILICCHNQQSIV